MERWTLFAVRALALSPLWLGLGLYLGSPAFRGQLDAGMALLIAADLDGLASWGAALGAWAPLAMSALMVAQALAAPIPSVLITLANSLIFGPFWGALLSISSASVAAGICYGLARSFGEPLVERFVPQSALGSTRALVSRHGTAAVLVSRLLPFVPFDPISYVAGLVSMRFWPFFWATTLGQIPAGFAYSYLGQELDNPLRFAIIGAAAFAALAVIGWSARRALGISDGDDTHPSAP